MKNRRLISKILVVSIVLTLLLSIGAFCETTEGIANTGIPSINLSIGDEASDNGGVVTSVQIILLLTILTIAPSILLMMTCFTRIIIVFSFVRRSLSLQTIPPNQVIIGLALFLTFFIMAPTFSEIKENAYDPFVAGEIDQTVAYEAAVEPLREFMLRQVRTKDLKLFVDISGQGSLEAYEDIPLPVLIPAFIISEIKTGFEIGFLLFIPFIVIDMITASTLMALGMMMLPPVMISLPFKILLFIMVDGWNLIIEKLIMTIR
ncbi:MAG: flagellar type III secretion system pore protein FliP [Clostridia bacterium]|nr:flagellar type III secretion system pore protein FliP [Clostridia bacterium]